MENCEVLILRRNDLITGKRDIPVHQIDIASFRTGVGDKFVKFNLVLFVDDDGVVFVIKNRWGKTTKQHFHWLLKRNEQTSQRYMEAEKFIADLGDSRWRFLTPLSLRRRCLKFIEKVLEKYDF